jgi:hypothetical protein
MSVLAYAVRARQRQADWEYLIPRPSRNMSHTGGATPGTRAGCGLGHGRAAARDAGRGCGWAAWRFGWVQVSWARSAGGELGEFFADGSGVGVGEAKDAGAVGDHLAVEFLGFAAAALAGGQPGEGGP